MADGGFFRMSVNRDDASYESLGVIVANNVKHVGYTFANILLCWFTFGVDFVEGKYVVDRYVFHCFSGGDNTRA